MSGLLRREVIVDVACSVVSVHRTLECTDVGGVGSQKLPQTLLSIDVL